MTRHHQHNHANSKALDSFAMQVGGGDSPLMIEITSAGKTLKFNA
jgi:hypothetical protein